MTWVCLCAFTFASHEHVDLFLCNSTVECECPFHEDGERAQEELVVSSATRHRINHRRHLEFKRSKESDSREESGFSYMEPQTVQVGHQLSNGLCAPLLI